MVTRSIKAITTDSSIEWELRNHQVYINPECSSNNKLLIHLVGTFDNPTSTTYLPMLATSNGYKVINLNYPNDISATTVCRTSSDIDCHWKFRQEIVFGTDESADVSVNGSNSIINRLEKLLIHLNDLYPLENWSNFLTESDEINWNEISISGHSQGGGHAAFIGKNFDVDRVLMFASPNEYSSFFSAPVSWISMPKCYSRHKLLCFRKSI